MDKNNEVTRIACSEIGLSGTTDCHVQKQDDGRYEARIGFAVFGQTNMSVSEFEQVDYNPFHARFYDNYSSGFGNTQDEAIANLKVEMGQTAESLWA